MVEEGPPPRRRQGSHLLGAAVDVSVPVGHAFSNQAAGEDYYLGNSSPITAGVRAIFDAMAGPLQFGANLRGVFRESAQLANTKIGQPTSAYGMGLAYKVSPIFRVVGEGTGSTQFSSANGTNTLEADGALELSPLESRVIIRAGGGAGILQGVGVPVGRALLGITYAHEVGDIDGDGIPDDIDKCPTIREDFDGFEDHDGCPDPDNDGDFIPDATDRCPNEPETINGFQDADGCFTTRSPTAITTASPTASTSAPTPAAPTSSGTPRAPTTAAPTAITTACPTSWTSAPDVPEPTDELFDGSGCPHVHDRDHDGIPDDVDKCPDEPETYNGSRGRRRLPPTKGPVAVDVSETSINVHESRRVRPGQGQDRGRQELPGARRRGRHHSERPQGGSSSSRSRATPTTPGSPTRTASLSRSAPRRW